MEYEASFELDTFINLEVTKLYKLLMHEVDGLVQHIAHMVQNVVKHYGCETVVTTSSELGIGHIKSKYC